MQGRIHSLESFGTVDGPGTRFVVFVQGCPMRCAYCHNPDTWEMNAGTLMEPEEIIAQYEHNLPLYQNGGGLTVTGGEPLMHAGFIRAFRELCGAKWRLSAETCLNIPRDRLDEAIACVDEFIVDIKSMDATVYRRYTGGDNGPVLRNLRTLARAVPPENVKIRVPLIPRDNDAQDQQRSETLLRDMGFTRIETFRYVIRK